MRLTAITVLMMAVASASAFPVPKVDKTPDLTGTTWSGNGLVPGQTRFTFGANGVLTYSYGGKSWTNGTWKQDGDKLIWECNGKYCEFEGRVTGDEIAGKEWNVAGLRAEVRLKRETTPDKADTP